MANDRNRVLTEVLRISHANKGRLSGAADDALVDLVKYYEAAFRSDLDAETVSAIKGDLLRHSDAAVAEASAGYFTASPALQTEFLDAANYAAFVRSMISGRARVTRRR